jgi:hypothetical protein
MRYLIVNEDATPAELCEAIANLRIKQRHAVIPSTRDEIGEEIDELLEMLPR